MTQKEFKIYRLKRCNNTFIDLIAKESNADTPIAKKVVQYMVEHNLIKQSVINRYVVAKEYPRFLAAEGTKNKAALALSNHIPVEPRRIFSILANDYASFEHCGNKT